MTGTTGQGVTEENGSTEGKERGRPEKKIMDGHARGCLRVINQRMQTNV